MSEHYGSGEGDFKYVEDWLAEKDAEIARLRAALEEIIRESQGAGNKGPIAAYLARRALSGETAETGRPRPKR